MGIRNYLKNLENRTYKNATPNVMGARYAYVFGFTKNGKKVVDGPFAIPLGAESCEEAETILAEFPQGEIFVFKTRDLSKAKKEIKAILLSRGEDPDEALKRILKKKD